MAEFNFGQPDGGIVQAAYVVPRLYDAIASWTNSLGVGPWFVAEHFLGTEPRYLGAVTTMDISVALAFNGSLCIELIEQHDDQPSVFRDLIATGRYGFHHWGIGTRDFDGLKARHEAAGFAALYTDKVPGGGRVAFHDAVKVLPGMIELIEMTDGVEDLFHHICRASVDWDRGDPVRSLT